MDNIDGPWGSVEDRVDCVFVITYKQSQSMEGIIMSIDDCNVPQGTLSRDALQVDKVGVLSKCTCQGASIIPNIEPLH